MKNAVVSCALVAGIGSAGFAEGSAAAGERCAHAKCVLWSDKPVVIDNETAKMEFLREQSL